MNKQQASEGVRTPAAAGMDARAIQNAARAVTTMRPEPLRGVRVPSRSMPARRLVVQLYEACPHLSRADLWTAVRWAELSLKFRRLSEYLDMQPEGGVVRMDGEPRKALSEFRQLADAISRHEQALGVSAAARASLGVNVGRMADLAALMAGRGEQ